MSSSYQENSSGDIRSYVCRFVKDIDCFGKEVNFLIEGKKHFKTVLGGILTLLLITFIIISVIYFGEDLVLKANPSSFEAKELLDETPIVKIDLNNFYTGIRIEDDSGGVINNSSFFHSYAVYEKYSRKPPQMDLLRDKSVRIPMELCNDLYTNISYFDGQDYFLCPRLDNITLGGDWYEDSIDIVTLYIKNCNASTAPENVTCASQEVKNKRSKLFFFGVKHHDVLINPKDYTSPIKQTYSYESYNIDLNMRKIFTAFYRIILSSMRKNLLTNSFYSLQRSKMRIRTC